MKKLHRQKDNIIGGVCGGIGNYSDIDESIIRLIFAGLFFTPFPIITMYLIAWIITPLENYE